MGQAKLKQIWQGNCDNCGAYFPFSPDKPMIIKNDNHSKCFKCGAVYFINRELGTYILLHKYPITDAGA